VADGLALERLPPSKIEEDGNPCRGDGSVSNTVEYIE
jgi:hypothetical protein